VDDRRGVLVVRREHALMLRGELLPELGFRGRRVLVPAVLPTFFQPELSAGPAPRRILERTGSRYCRSGRRA
jgi:hypothetical protein